jgi:hypothetical protein
MILSNAPSAKGRAGHQKEFQSVEGISIWSHNPANDARAKVK